MTISNAHKRAGECRIPGARSGAHPGKRTGNGRAQVRAIRDRKSSLRISSGDGYFDGGNYNTPESGYDGGDVLEFVWKYPNCTVDFPLWVGDGWCESLGKYNSPECGYD